MLLGHKNSENVDLTHINFYYTLTREKKYESFAKCHKTSVAIKLLNL